MNGEEAIEVIKAYRDKLTNSASNQLDGDIEAFDIAIKALELEPCENAISRQAVNTLVDELARTISDERCFMSRGRSTSNIMQDILDLPPVNPQPKAGHWIIHPKGIYAHLICDNCLSNAPYDCRTNYCPNCGCRMVEPQESEVQE